VAERKLKCSSGALVHEIGHVAFAEYLTDDEKAEWFALHMEAPPQS
jgi:hypothetical protein